MSKLINLDDDKELQKMGKEKPKWLEAKDGNRYRVVFLTLNVPIEITYNLHDRTVGKDSNSYKGTYKSLTAKTIPDRDKIIEIINKGDPDKQLKIDAKTLGEPGYLSVVPVFVYPIDEDGDVNKEALKVWNFQLSMLRLSPFIFSQIRDISKRLKKKEKKITDIDILLVNKSGTKTFDLTPILDEESLYNDYKEKLLPKVKKKLKHEYDRLGVADLETFGKKFLGIELTEDQWYGRLSRYGYDVGAPDTLGTMETVETVPADKGTGLDLDDEEDLDLDD